MWCDSGAVKPGRFKLPRYERSVVYSKFNRGFPFRMLAGVPHTASAKLFNAAWIETLDKRSECDTVVDEAG